MQRHAPDTLGRLTRANLTDTSVFGASVQADVWQVERKPFSRPLARMSAELAANGYDLDIKPWRAAGWEDLTFIVEDRIVPLDAEEDSRLPAIESEWKRRRAKSWIRGVNPFNDLFRAMRQLIITDLGKGIVMTKEMAEGRRVVAVSFIGTTQKYFDWFANFKFQQASGMHYGFMELARQFMGQAARILLPRLAATLGEETYTLADVLLEAQRPDSRVCLWICGHSQGGAIAQTFTHLLMEAGVPASAIQAYTYAAPTVATAGCGLDPSRYPIYNIINADDVITRVGADLRLGVDWIYHPMDAFRRAHYGVEQEQWSAFSRAMFLASRVQSMNDALCWILALVRWLGEQDGEESTQALLKELYPYHIFLKRINLSMGEICGYIEEKLVAQIRELTGAEPDEALCAYFEDALGTFAREMEPEVMGRCLMQSIGGPHRIRPDAKDDAFVPPYLAIVQRHLDSCLQGVWLPDTPRCLAADGEQLLPDRLPAPPLDVPQAKALPEA